VKRLAAVLASFQEDASMFRNSLIAGLVAVALSGCASQEQKKSIELTNDGVKLLRQKAFDAAEGKLGEATRAYRDNHTAWYNLGLARDGMKKYADAAAAYEQAVKLSSKDAMYHMQHGIAAYNALIAEARKRAGSAAGKDPSTINPEELDLTAANFDPALQSLESSVKLNAELFRAHYYMGRIFRHQDNGAAAAQSFTKAIEANPRFGNSYIALGELYRRWDYTDEALQVLEQGKANVPDDREKPMLLFVLGMAHNDKRDYAKAIEQFTGALENDRNLHLAKYQRGMAYFRLNEFKKAKQDLEEYQKSSKDEQTKNVASKTLMDIMAKTM
jgi:tetratricopeptide (TPR) repeat protein